MNVLERLIETLRDNGTLTDEEAEPMLANLVKQRSAVTRMNEQLRQLNREVSPGLSSVGKGVKCHLCEKTASVERAELSNWLHEGGKQWVCFACQESYEPRGDEDE